MSTYNNSRSRNFNTFRSHNLQPVSSSHKQFQSCDNNVSNLIARFPVLPPPSQPHSCQSFCHRPHQRQQYQHQSRNSAENGTAGLDNSIIMAVPVGTPHYLWFTQYKHVKYILLIPISDNSAHPVSAHIVPLIHCYCNSCDLCQLFQGNGTILHGIIPILAPSSTHAKKNNRIYPVSFIATSILFLNGHELCNYGLFDKPGYSSIEQFMQQYYGCGSIGSGSSGEHTKTIQVMMASTALNVRDMMRIRCHYPVQEYRQIFASGKIVVQPSVQYGGNNCIAYPETNGTQRDLWICPDTQNDIYYVYTNKECSRGCGGCSGQKKDGYLGVLLVPSYRKSVQLNTLFRRIKENERLDALEESDDEDEFQNVADDKYLIEKNMGGILLPCVWNSRHKKWMIV